jgi:hypothetical protein
MDIKTYLQSAVMEELVYYQQLLVTIMVAEVAVQHIQVDQQVQEAMAEEEQELKVVQVLME